MNKQEFIDLMIGDVVIISAANSNNLGRRGVVTDINRKGSKGNISVKPLDGEFEPSKGYDRTDKNGDRCWCHPALQVHGNVRVVSVEKQEPKMEIYKYAVSINDHIVYKSVVSTNEREARTFVYDSLYITWKPDEFTIKLDCILPIAIGVII